VRHLRFIITSCVCVINCEPVVLTLTHA